MSTFTYDHIHLRSTDPEKTAAYYARMFDAEIIRTMQDVIAGHVKVMFSSLVQTTPFIHSGQLRALGTGGAKRNPVLPDVPTIAEAGLPGYEFTTWHGILAPKATPRPIVALLNDRLKKSLAAPDQAKRFQDHGLDVIASTPGEFAAFLATEYNRWGKVIKERGMRAE